MYFYLVLIMYSVQVTHASVIVRLVFVILAVKIKITYVSLFSQYDWYIVQLGL